MTHNRQSSGGTKSFSYVGSNLHRGTSNVVFTLRQWDTVRKILPWPRHYQSTSSTMPYKEISTNRLFCFWQEKSKTVSPWKLITGAHIASGIDISNSHREATLPSFSKVWDHSKRNLHRSNKNKNQFIWWARLKYGTWHRWEKNDHIATFNKSNNAKHTQLQFRQNHFLPW